MTTAPMSLRSFEHSSVVACCLIALMLLSAPWNGTAGEIYKSVDAKGQVTYSDKPSPDAERIYIRTDPNLSEADRARMAAEQEARTRAEEDRAKRADAAKQEQAQRAQTAQTKREQCRQARNRDLMFTTVDDCIAEMSKAIGSTTRARKSMSSAWRHRGG